MITAAETCLFIGPGLKDFKLNLFNRIGSHIKKLGGTTISGDFDAVRRLPDSVVPIIGCSPELKNDVVEWKKRGRRFIYWDRGYARRIFATHLPRGTDGGYYRWHVNAYQMSTIRDVTDDRWKSLDTPVGDWQKKGDHVLIAAPSRTYCKFHQIESWIADTIDGLARVTKRPLWIRDKESKRPFLDDLKNCHALVTHGSNAAVEAAILGYPVFVDRSSAASLVGRTDIREIEAPVYPDRSKWLSSLAYSQYSESELVDGTLWRLMQ